MTSITIKNLPTKLLGRLRVRARKEKRSLNRQIIHILERSLDRHPTREDIADQARRQVEAWRKLAGRWVSDRSTEEEIGEIYESRTVGREVPGLEDP